MCGTAYKWIEDHAALAALQQWRNVKQWYRMVGGEPAVADREGVGKGLNIIFTYWLACSLD